MGAVRDKIVLQQGDLTLMEVDAIVNAANTDLQLGGGVAGAIRNRGGPRIQEECNKVGPVELGGAAITTAGRLKARHVIHAASMEFGGLASPDTVRNATRSALARAAEKNLKTIAFPAIGTGIAGFQIKPCAEIMLDEAAKHLAGHTSLEKVYFVLFDAKALETFRAVWAEMQKKGQV